MPENLPQPVPPPPVQTSLFPDPATTSAPPPPPAVPRADVAPRWLQRLSLFIFVLFCIYLGVILTVLPWSTRVYDHNLFLTSHEHLWSILRLGPVRGIISGLGLLDIWIGISEAVNYRDTPKPTP